MLWTPQKGRVLVEHNAGTVAAVTTGTAVTTGATAPVKGTVAQIFAATAFDSYWMRIIASAYGEPATACAGALDILVGAATEEMLVPDLLMGYCGGGPAVANQNGPKVWDFPLYIPAGTRISAQAAGERVSIPVQVAVFLYGGNGYPPFRVGSKVTTYGMGTVPNGTAVTPGINGAEGSWTQITAASTEDHFALVPSFQPSADTTTTSRTLLMDLGVGAATEEMVAESYWYQTSGTETMCGPNNSMPTFQDIPSGTRLTTRVSNHGTNDGAYNACIHAVS